MKQPSIRLVRQRSLPGRTWADTLCRMLPALCLTTGLWAMAGSALEISVFLPCILSAIALFLALWIGRCRRRGLLTGILLGGISLLVLLAYPSLQGSLAEALNRIFAWLTRKTGIYHLPFQTQGQMLPILVLTALLAGFGAGVLVQLRHPLWLLLLLPPLLPAAAGILTDGWAMGLYLAGVFLLMAVYASGSGKPLITAALISGVSLCLFGGIFSAVTVPAPPASAGTALSQFIHQHRYESVPNPMPEGMLQELPPYLPGNEPALEVTMDHWTALYIRGYVGSVYTSRGWEPVSPEDAAQNAEALYALQSECFFPVTQPDAAWRTTDTPCQNAVTVKNVGACRAYSYLPYGAGAVTDTPLDPSQLVGEGTSRPDSGTVSAELWPVEESYLLQEQLSRQESSPYLQTEAVYRDWVYRTFLTLPEETRELLQTYIRPGGNTLSTTQAKVEITQLLDSILTYKESSVTKYGRADFADYVLNTNPKGYSVHYATLATLFMRSCGIPARYVEGYVVTPAQAEVMADGETLTLRQSGSHAWCEYYLDGVGWLPFDATPGYTEILDYRLPENGIPSENQQSGGHLKPPDTSEQPHDRPLPVEQKPEPEGLSHWVYLRQALSILSIVLLLAFLALGIRTLLLRRRLRRQKERFTDPDLHLASGCILCYGQHLLALTEKAASPPASVTDRQITELANEIWFSTHPITPQQHALSLQWLEDVTVFWQQNTRPLRRWWLRWIRCKVI